MARRPVHGLASLVQERPIEAIEQLDVMVRVVPLRSWFTLAAAFLALGVLAAFAVQYQVPIKVEGKGILLAQRPQGADPLVQVTAPASGRVANVAVKIEDIVREGQILGLIDQKELDDQITAAVAELARLRDEDRRLTALDRNEAQIQENAQVEVTNALKRGIVLDRERLGVLHQLSAGVKSLQGRGMLAATDALKSQAEVDSLDSTIAVNEARIFEHAYSHLRDETARRRDALKRSLDIEAAEIRLRLLRERHDRDTRIVSPYAGRIVDLMITPHGAVDKGTTAVLLEPSDHLSTLEAIVFVPAGQGKRIHEHDAVEVSPDTIRRQEHGFICGSIRSVSKIPCTDQAMLAELKHPALVASLVEKYRGQVLLNIKVTLDEAIAPPGDDDGSVKNRLVWSSSSGRRREVTGGTTCSTLIVVERRPLLALVMPWFRRLIGDE